MISDTLWTEIRALDGLTLQTPEQQRPFLIQHGVGAEMRVSPSSGKQSYPVRRADFDRVFDLGLPIEQLRPGMVKRLLEASGPSISCASYVVAILRHLHQQGRL